MSLRVGGIVMTVVVAFTRLPSTRLPSSGISMVFQSSMQPCLHTLSSQQRRSPSPATTMAALLPLSFPLYCHLARGSLSGGGDRLSPSPSNLFNNPVFDEPVSSEPTSSSALANAIEALLPVPGTSVIDAAEYFDSLPDLPVYVPSLVSELPNVLLDGRDGQDLHAEVLGFAPHLLYVAARHAQRLTELSRSTATSHTSIQLLPGIRLPIGHLPHLYAIRERAEILHRWREALDFVGPYTSEGAEGVTQQNQHQVAVEVRQHLASIAYDAPSPGAGGFPLSPLDLATFLSTRWFNDEMFNSGLDWLTRELGPHSDVAIANALFLEWLQGTRSQNRYI